MHNKDKIKQLQNEKLSNNHPFSWNETIQRIVEMENE